MVKLCLSFVFVLYTQVIESCGSGVELQTLDYKNPVSNPVKTLGKFFHSTLLQFTQLYK